MKAIVILIFPVLFIAAGCSSQTSFKEKKLVLKSKETVRISEVDLTITNNGCGRKWVSSEGNPGSEKPYCNLVYKKGDSTVIAGHDFKPVYLGNVEITLERINPWGKEEDSIPPGGCRLWVRLLEGR